MPHTPRTPSKRIHVSVYHPQANSAAPGRFEMVHLAEQLQTTRKLYEVTKKEAMELGGTVGVTRQVRAEGGGRRGGGNTGDRGGLTGTRAAAGLVIAQRLWLHSCVCAAGFILSAHPPTNPAATSPRLPCLPRLPTPSVQLCDAAKKELSGLAKQLVAAQKAYEALAPQVERMEKQLASTNRAFDATKPELAALEAQLERAR